MASSIIVALLFIFPFFIEIGLPSFVISVMQYLLSWWMGVIIADVFTGRIRIQFRYLAIPAIIIPSMAIWGGRIQNSIVADTLWALGFAGLLSFVFFLYGKNLRVIFLEKLSWLGECSYTLYILHFPIFVFLNGMLLEKTTNVMPKTQLLIILFSLIMVAIAYGIHFVIEKPFSQKKPYADLALLN